VSPQIDFVFKHDESRRSALRIAAQKMLQLKMVFQRLVIAKVLVREFLLFADVTLVMVACQVHVEFVQIVKSRGTTEFAQGMSATALSIAVLQVMFELRRCVTRECGNEIALVLNTELAECQAMSIL
jgi:hypothetical protein